MLAIQQWGLTQFKPENWEEKTVKENQWMRLVNNQERLKAANLVK